jgi:hypothetical protein
MRVEKSHTYTLVVSSEEAVTIREALAACGPGTDYPRGGVVKPTFPKQLEEMAGSLHDDLMDEMDG